MKNLTIRVSLLLLAIALVLPAFASASDTGADLFKSKCAMCHGANGSANTPMAKNLKLKDMGSAEVQKMSDAELKTTIEKGKPPKMPAYGSKLSSTQIDGLVKYLRTLKK